MAAATETVDTSMAIRIMPPAMPSTPEIALVASTEPNSSRESVSVMARHNARKQIMNKANGWNMIQSDLDRL